MSLLDLRDKEKKELLHQNLMTIVEEIKEKFPKGIEFEREAGELPDPFKFREKLLAIKEDELDDLYLIDYLSNEESVKEIIAQYDLGTELYNFTANIKHSDIFMMDIPNPFYTLPDSIIIGLMILYIAKVTDENEFLNNLTVPDLKIIVDSIVDPILEENENNEYDIVLLGTDIYSIILVILLNSYK